MALTWLITGSSSGFGLALVRYLLSQNQHVTSNPNGRWLALDVTSPKAEVEKAIQSAWEEFGSIDVLINNAGYSILGAAEDIPEEEARKQFEVNFWGLLRTTQAALPLMRSRKTGTIMNITSIAGLDAVPSGSVYAASKFAVEAWSESLSKEVAPLGLRVLIVEPGAFRTNFLHPGASPHVAASEAYKNGPVSAMLEKFVQLKDAQPGDPEKAAKCIFEVVTSTGRGANLKDVLRLPLGPDCHSRAVAALEGRLKNFRCVYTVTVSTNLG